MTNKITLDQLKSLLKWNKTITIHANDLDIPTRFDETLVELANIHPWVVLYGKTGNRYMFFKDKETYEIETRTF